MWPFKKKPIDYRAGSVIYPADMVEDVMKEAGIEGVNLFDEKYSQMTEKNLKEMIAAEVKPFKNTYKEDVFDCDDAARVVWARISEAAYSRGFQAPIAFGTVEYTRNDGQEHMMNFAITAENKIIYYDQYEGKWYNTPPNMKQMGRHTL